METDKMELLYEKAAEIINNIIPIPWKKVRLYAEVSEEGRQVFFYFYPKEKNSPVYSLDIISGYNVEEKYIEDLEDELYDVFTELSNEFERQKQEKWTNLTFTLDNSGKFNIDYKYNDLAGVDPYEQQIIWEYEKIGILPHESRKIDLKIIQDYKRNVNNAIK